MPRLPQANSQAVAESLPPLASSTTPKTSGPRKPAPKPNSEYTASAAPSRAGSAALIRPAVNAAESAITATL